MADILGHMYQHNTDYTVSISASSTDYIVDNMTCGVKRGIGFQNGQEFKVITPGIYFVFWHLAFTAGAANQEIEGGIAVNGTRDDSTTGHRTISTGTDSGSMSGVGMLILAANALIQLVVRNNTSTNDVIVGHCQITAKLETTKVG